MAIYKKKESETQNRYYKDFENGLIMQNILYIVDNEVECLQKKATSIPQDAVSSSEEEFNGAAAEPDVYLRVGTRPNSAP